MITEDFTSQLIAETQSAHGELMSTGAHVKHLALLLWTSNVQLPVVGGSLFSIVNHVIRNDIADAPGQHHRSGMQPAARIARCICELCVNPALPPGLDLPAVGAAAAMKRVFRGGGFDPKHRMFFDERASAAGDSAFRIPQFWATSLTERVAQRFMKQNSGALSERNLESVLWQVDMVATVPMWNAALVEQTDTHFQGEQEYLFVPYSTFVLLDVSWSTGTHSDPHRINLLARDDNRKESMDYPTAPWA